MIEWRPVLDLRSVLKQGGLGSMDWFSYGVDPVLGFLER